MANSVKTKLPDFRRLRRSRNLTLRQVELMTGISNSYLSQLESGKIHAPSFDTVIKLLGVYINNGKDLDIERLYSKEDTIHDSDTGNVPPLSDHEIDLFRKMLIKEAKYGSNIG